MEWPHGLRRGTAAASLLRVCVRFPLGQGYLSLVSVVCCQVQVPVSGRSLVKRSPKECGVSEYDREASIIRRSWSSRGCCALEKCRKEKQNKLRTGL